MRKKVLKLTGLGVVVYPEAIGEATMPLAHERERQGLALLLKKIKFSPVISIQGPRQCGKSYFASKLLARKLKSSQFKSLDVRENRQLADSQPRLFLETPDVQNLIIDEVQKVPHLFDEIKALVDEDRQPGRFIILGSTEFSIESKIKESLTGRLTRLRMYPMNLSEVQKLGINPIKKFPFVGTQARAQRSDVLKYLRNGGLPGIFIIKSELERTQSFRDWVDLTVSRDIFQFRDKKLDADLAEQILFKIAHLETPTSIHIANALGKSTAVIQKHLKALKNLFVIDEIKPYIKSSGKSVYYLCDVGVLDYFRAELDRKVTTWILNELKSQLSYKGESSDKIFYFKSARSSMIQFVYFVENTLSAVKVISRDQFDQRDILAFESLKKKHPQAKLQLHLLYGGTQQVKQGEVLVSPWEFLV